MKIPKWAIIATAVLLVVVVGLSFHFYMRAKISAAVAQEQVKAKQAEIVAIDGQLQEGHAINAEYEASLEAARADAKAQQAAFLVALGKVKAATPAQLVDQGGQVVGATDIVLSADKKTVTMGVETYRKFVLKAVDDDQYISVKEPAWNAREALYQKDISTYKQNEILYDRRDALNAGIISDLRGVISHQKTTSVFEKIVWSAAGFGAGVLADKIIK
jgi:hypothetical protein